ncbi:MAG: hypothetical protein SFU99_01125 [Saprospiraceae bacterium]|nr:hypothetical protein [Saprospiraceae bacterium]
MNFRFEPVNESLENLRTKTHITITPYNYAIPKQNPQLQNQTREKRSHEARHAEDFILCSYYASCLGLFQSYQPLGLDQDLFLLELRIEYRGLRKELWKIPYS